jgi:hypothetical protein
VGRFEAAEPVLSRCHLDSRSELVADLPQQAAPPFDALRILDALWPNPSTTPSIARPCSVSASTTSVGFAVAQKIRQTSGTAFIVFSTLIG